MKVPVANFSIILGNEAIWIGDDAENKPAPVLQWSEKFRTGGSVHRGGIQQALLTFNVSQLTRSIADVPILINGKEIGTIRRYDGEMTKEQAALSSWYSQTLCFDASVLKSDDENEIVIKASKIRPGSQTAKDNWDDFLLKDVVCWYHLDVDVS
jgi:hypothetical protein